MARISEDGPAARERLAEALAEDILAIASDAIISIDEQHRIIRFNEGAATMFGWPREQALGKPLDILLPSRFRAIHAEHIRRFAASEVKARRMGERQEISGLRRNGDEFPAEASISKLPTADGWVFTVVLRDISERKRAERTQRFLAEAGELLASSIEYEPTLQSVARLAVPTLADWCVVFIADEQGALSGLELVHADPSMQPVLDQLRDLPLDPTRPHPVFTAIETGEPELIERVDERYLRAISTDSRMYEVYTRLRLRSLLTAPLIGHGHTGGAIGLFSASRRFTRDDVPIVRELAARAGLAVENARLYGAAQRAVRARDDVLSVVTHDISNTLTAIRIGTGLLLRKVPAAERAQGGWAHLEAVLHSVAQMEKLIEHLLQVKRLEAGQYPLHRQPEPIGEIITEVVDLYAPQAADQSITLQAVLEAALPAVDVDRTRVVQVLSNLVGNALKFTPAGGRITIEAVRSEAEMIVRVRDTGRGITPEELPHVFDRFWQSKHHGIAGAGLGLAIARGLVEAHGGRIRVESELDVGTTFSFSLPTSR